MGKSGRISAVGLIVGLALAPIGLASCAHGMCSTAGYDASLVGRLTAKSPGHGVFVVESVAHFPGRTLGSHVPAIGSTVTVDYAGGQERFLHVGDRYLVGVVWDGRHLTSGVHVAEDSCSGGTVHADGTAIDTSRFPWFKAHVTLIGVAIASVSVVLILGGALRSRRRRRPESVVVDDRYL